MGNNKQQKDEKLFERIFVVHPSGTSYFRNATIDELEMYKKLGYVKYLNHSITLICPCSLNLESYRIIGKTIGIYDR
jgi:hypothetical protein